jgi:DNA-directed RNA polymerase subunit N (RpoN/RPB10)
MSKRCYECGITHSTKWSEYTVMEENGYGTPTDFDDSVPIYVKVDVYICEECEDMANDMDEYALLNR